jgi:hypothetical protein
MKDFLNGYYAAFLCQHGREQDAREFGGCPPSALPATQQRTSHLNLRPSNLP